MMLTTDPALKEDPIHREILGSGLTTADLVRTAWAPTYRGTDRRGGPNLDNRRL